MINIHLSIKFQLSFLRPLKKNNFLIVIQKSSNLFERKCKTIISVCEFLVCLFLGPMERRNNDLSWQFYTIAKNYVDLMLKESTSFCLLMLVHAYNWISQKKVVKSHGDQGYNNRICMRMTLKEQFSTTCSYLRLPFTTSFHKTSFHKNITTRRHEIRNDSKMRRTSD